MRKKFQALFILLCFLLAGLPTKTTAANTASLIVHIKINNNGASNDEADYIYYAIEMLPAEETPGMKALIRYISSGKNQKIRSLTAKLNGEMSAKQTAAMQVKPYYTQSKKEISSSWIAHYLDFSMYLFDSSESLGIDFIYPGAHYHTETNPKSLEVTYTLADIS